MIARKNSPLLPEEEKDYYQILKVPETASLIEIRNAYEQLLETVHEESLAAYSLCPEEETEQKLLQLSLAYMKLADPDARIKYDQELRQRSIQSQKQISGPERNISRIEKETWKSRLRKVIYLRSPNSERSENRRETPEHFSEKMLPAKQIESTSPFVDNAPREIDSQTLQERRKSFQSLAQKNESSQERIDAFYSTLNSHDGKSSYNGLVLQQIRQLKSITLEELATVTCVRSAYLKAIENEDFSRFSSAVYLKGYLQCYAKAMDLPVEQVIKDYMQLTENAQWS